MTTTEERERFWQQEREDRRQEKLQDLRSILSATRKSCRARAHAEPGQWAEGELAHALGRVEAIRCQVRGDLELSEIGRLDKDAQRLFGHYCPPASWSTSPTIIAGA